MIDSEALDLLDETGPPLQRRILRPGFAMRLASRIGVWGVLGGTVALLAPVLGIPLPFGLFSIGSGIGFLAGGLGIATASYLVLRETSGSRRILKYAALTGVPFGLLAAAHGAILLWFMPWVLEHLAIGNMLTIGAVGLAVILTVLLAAGLLKGVWGESEEDSEFSITGHATRSLRSRPYAGDLFWW